MKIKKKKVSIRFYEELNDFLPKEKRKKRFTHNFIDRTSVKDLIESLGVPHTEIDLILVNGKSVDFNYLINDGDDISVYPVFESLDISDIQHLRAKPLRKPKFICDVHLGKLARNLRMFGIDVYYKNYLNDEEIVKISLAEKRTILTRDTGLLKRSEVTHGYFVRNDEPEKQTAEVISRFSLMKIIKPFTLCLDCGSKLVKINKKDILHLIPENVKQIQNKFFYCVNCKKIFWAGSHLNNMTLFIKEMMKQMK
ncbi:MAG: Mut7-C RNAse domain-containing protein [Ignavibacterium sp.]|uniref:Mut7-C RNAse domain-containing protein n=1 Tax=Ignavibacterium sp. TaxID=2651167 RepID=UPI00404B364E